MKDFNYRFVYGPVPSRRLGRSLGVDLVPLKTCSYDCIYCQLGCTTHKTIERKHYVAMDSVLEELDRKLAVDPMPDYISLAGSGEPTLNLCIGNLIDMIKGRTKIPLAVITNGSLLWVTEVQDALMNADLVIPSLDAGNEVLFQCVNRPLKELSFEQMVNGIATFTEQFRGEVWLEVMLLGGVTGIPAEAKKIAGLVRQIRPARVQLNTVSRPPAEDFAFSLSPDQMVALKDFFPNQVDIICENGKDDALTSVFSGTEKEVDIMALLCRRPCTAADVANGLGIHVTEALKHLGGLIANGKAKTVVTGGRHFYTVC